jgi:hypothetical protein
MKQQRIIIQMQQKTMVHVSLLVLIEVGQWVEDLI